MLDSEKLDRAIGVGRVMTRPYVHHNHIDRVLAVNADRTVFTVIDNSIIEGKREVYTSLVVRLIGHFVVVEYDDNDLPLVDALVQDGIPRTQIILAYEGEPIPETA